MPSHLNDSQFNFLARFRSPRSGDPIEFEDDTTQDEYEDVNGPPNLGRRRPIAGEWSDYIHDEQIMQLMEMRDSRLARNPNKRRKYKKRQPRAKLSIDDAINLYMEDE